MQNYVIFEKTTGVQVFLAVTSWILMRRPELLKKLYLWYEALELKNVLRLFLIEE